MPTLAGLSIWTQRLTSRIRAISEIPLRCDADILAQLRKTRSSSKSALAEHPLRGGNRSGLTVVFYIEGNLVITVDVGSHDIYRA
jgi:hypothetical protein